MLEKFRGLLLGAAIGAVASSGSNPVPDSVTYMIKLSIEFSKRPLSAVNLVIKTVMNSSVETLESLEIKLAALFVLTLMTHDDQLQRNTAMKPLLASMTDPSEAEHWILLSDLIVASLQGKTLCLATYPISNPIQANRPISGARPRYKTPIPNATSLLGEAVAQLLQTHATLAQAQQRLGVSTGSSPSAIAIALYCWASTPRAFELSLRRANHPAHRSLTPIITGALSGLTLGAVRVPLAWQIQVGAQSFEQDSPSTFASSADLSIRVKMLNYADRLFATWAGIDSPEGFQSHQANAIATPGMLKPRI